MTDRRLRTDFQHFTEDLHLQLLNGMLVQREEALRDLQRLAGQIHTQLTTRYLHEDSLVRLRWIEEQSGEIETFVASQRLSGYVTEARQRIQVLGQSFDSVHEYVQQERCFTVSPTDTSYQVALKRLKRTSRSIRLALHNLKARSFAVLGRSKPAEPVWIHSVNWALVTRIAGNLVVRRLLDAVRDDLRLRNELAACLVALSDAGLNKALCKEHLESASAKLSDLIRTIEERIQASRPEMEEQVQGDLDHLYLKLIYAGTVHAPAELNDEEKATKEADQLRVAYANQLKVWDIHTRTVLSQLEIDLGFQHYLSVIQRETELVADRLGGPFTQTLKPVIQRLTDQLETTADEFQHLEREKKESRQVLLKRVQKVTLKLNAFLEEEFLQTLKHVLGQTDIRTRLEEGFAEIVLNNGLLTAETRVFEQPLEKSNSELPVTDTERVDFRREITVYLNHELFRKMRLIPDKLVPLLEAMEKLGNDITQIVHVNMQVADELASGSASSETTIAELHGMIHDGLDRAASRARDLSQQVDRFLEQLNTLSREHVDVFRQLCERIMREDDYLYIRRRNREVKVTSTAVNWKQRVQRAWVKWTSSAEAWGRLALQRGRRQVSSIQVALGFETDDASGKLLKSEASQFLASTDRSLRQLPLIYRRLFNAEPLSELRFYKGRQQMQLIFDNAYGAWVEGTHTNLAIVGEKGSGKTTVLNMLQRQIESGKMTVSRGSFDHTIYDVETLLKHLCSILGMANVSNPQDFIEKLNASRNRRVVFLEGFQNIYLRFMHGFEALETFLLILTQTGGKVFWVVSSSRYAWQYLDKVYDLDGYFTHKRFVDLVGSSSLQDIVMSRHTVSGYDLRFEPTEELRDSRAYRKLSGDEAGQQTLLKNHYFEKLYEESKGNIAIALQYWQLSVKEIDEDTIVICPLEQLRLALGEGFSTNDLFALGAIIFHDDLTEQQLSDSLHIDFSTSRLILAKLTARSVLYRQQDRFYLNNLLYRQVVDLLKSRNILH